MKKLRRPGAWSHWPTSNNRFTRRPATRISPTGRPETAQRAAAEYANFYEFSRGKDVYRYVSEFDPTPWSFEVNGLCANPRTFDMDDIYREFTLEERAYRHRCVETWAMCVPWTGFPLARLLEMVEPHPNGKIRAV